MVPQLHTQPQPVEHMARTVLVLQAAEAGAQHLDDQSPAGRELLANLVSGVQLSCSPPEQPCGSEQEGQAQQQQQEGGQAHSPGPAPGPLQRPTGRTGQEEQVPGDEEEEEDRPRSQEAVVEAGEEGEGGGEEEADEIS